MPPRALLLKYPGTNCDSETARALRAVGFSALIQPIATATPAQVAHTDLIVLPGGFSYGDYVMSGRLAQLETERILGSALRQHLTSGGYLLGICNGFQILTQMGILPRASLIANTSDRFECVWDTLCKSSPTCPFTHLLPPTFELPSAHAEGRLVCPPGEARRLLATGCVPLTYAHNHNGSELSIASLQDPTQHALGLMPHPERFLSPHHHYDPDWSAHPTHGWGFLFFRSIYESIANQ